MTSNSRSRPTHEDDARLILAVRAARNVVLATTEVSARARPTSSAAPGRTAACRSAAASRPTRTTASTWTTGSARCRSACSAWSSFPIAAARTALGHQPHLPSGNSTWIDFPGPPGTIPRLSYSDVARGKFKPSDVRGKIVVVGATAESLHDYHSTSTSGGGLMAGPEIQAASMVTALAGFPLYDSPRWLDILLLVALGIAAPLTALRVRIFVALGVGDPRAGAVPRRRPDRLQPRHDPDRRLPDARRGRCPLGHGRDPRRHRRLRARAGARRLRALRPRGRRRRGAAQRRRDPARRRAARGDGHVQRPARLHLASPRRSSRRPSSAP